MTALTHSSISVFFNLVVLSFFSYAIRVEHLLAMILFALLPDIDTPGSFMGRLFFFISNKINLIFGHRGFIHSLNFLLLVIAATSIVFFVFPSGIFIFALILYVSYGTHIIADCFNLSGVRLLYPSPTVFVFPTDEGFRSRSGSLKVEIPVATFFIIISIIYYIGVIGNNGFISFLRVKFANPSMAKEQFISFEKSKYYADITIYDKIKRENLIFNNVEIFYTDTNKVIFPDAVGGVLYYDNSDQYTIKKVSLRKTNEIYAKHTFKGSLSKAVLEKFRVASGVIYLNDYSKTNRSIQKENDTLSLFFASKKELENIQKEVELKNELYAEKIREENKKLSSYTIIQANNTISRLQSDRTTLLSLVNGSKDIRTKLDISERISKIETKIDTLTLNLSIIDRAGDEAIYRKIEELKKQIVDEVSVDLVVVE